MAMKRSMVSMIKIILSRKLGELRMKQTELSRITGIRPSTINDLYNDMAARINLEHLDLICEALECDITDIIVRVQNKEPLVRHYRTGRLKES